MSIKLNTLETLKLLKEFKYIQSDLDFKSEFQKVYGGEFEKSIRRLLKDEPVIKRACKDKFGDKLDPPSTPSGGASPSAPMSSSTSTDMTIYSGDTSIEPIIKLDKEDPKLKELYRNIVQKTHPDKVNSDVLSDLYVSASDAYKKGDILEIYIVCSELNIKFEATDEEVAALKKRVKHGKRLGILFEQGYLWQWFHNKDENKRKEIIKHFLLHHAPSIKILFS